METISYIKDCIYRKLLGLPLVCPHCNKELPKELDIDSRRVTDRRKD